ncbi:hypothetical protein, partial [Streptomyces sp. NPDC001781]
MAYVPGSYLRELREAHQRGEHAEREDDNCPACDFRAVPEGFASLAEFADALNEGAAELQVHVDAHDRGEHRAPVGECIECA